MVAKEARKLSGSQESLMASSYDTIRHRVRQNATIAKTLIRYRLETESLGEVVSRVIVQSKWKMSQ